MNIAGLQKLSLIDYPGKVAAVVFTNGCNFKCGFCHNPELVLSAKAEYADLRTLQSMAKEDFFDFLESRKGFLDGVCITGGEPLLQEDIEKFIRSIKDKGFFVKLDTNGLLADKLENIIGKGLTDYIAMDIKTALDEGNENIGHQENLGLEALNKSFNADNLRIAARVDKEERIKYSNITGVNIDIEKIKKSIKLIMKSGIDYEFRTTVIKDWHRKEDILNIAKFIQGAKKYALQKFEIRDKILNDKFLSASSITRDEAEEWRRSCEEFVDVCELRGWS